MYLSSFLNSIKNSSQPTKFIVSRILIHLHLSQFFIIHLKHYKLRFFPTLLSRELWIDPEYLNKAWPFRIGFFWKYLKPGDVVIDVGSHIGTITLESAIRVENTGKIYSIEAHPRIFKYLTKNIQLNNLQNIQTFNFAIGNVGGFVNFSDLHTDPSNVVLQEGNGIKVPILKLDDLPIHENKIDMMKIYVEGYEKFVLFGAEKLLDKIQCIHFSSNVKKFKEYGYNLDIIFNFLLKHGFNLFRFQNSNKIISISENYVPKKEEILAIKNIEDFIKRTNFTISSSR